MCFLRRNTPIVRKALRRRGTRRIAGDRFYPAFQYLVWGGKSVDEAAQAAMFETAGEA